MKKRKFGFLLLVEAMLMFLLLPSMASAEDLLSLSSLLNCPASAAKMWSTAIGEAGQLRGCDRIQLSGNVYQYKALVKVGQGSHDLIGIHRVVKELAPWTPAKTAKAIMMLPGDTSSFNTNFLSKLTQAPSDQSLGVYLAQNDVDVWGIDYRWAFVTIFDADFSFMKDWNMAMHLKDIKTAVTVARHTRAQTDRDPGKIFMLGLSRGAQFVYAYAEAETQLPMAQRDLKGIVPMDYAYKFAPERADLKLAAQARYSAYKAQYDSGKYVIDDGARSKALALLAMVFPNAPSLVVPGVTNKQAALYALTATYSTFVPPMQSYTPTFHYVAGVFDDNSLPTGLQFSNYDVVTNKILFAPGYQSVGEMMDGDAIAGEVANGHYVDRLNQVTVPVLYVGAAGGYGDSGLYTPTLLGSADKSTLLISLLPAEYAAADFGHVDLVWALNAKVLVWAPIANWLQSH